MPTLVLRMSDELMKALLEAAGRDFRTPESEALFILDHTLLRSRGAKPLYQRARNADALIAELQKLHQDAGWPSSRALARTIWERQGRRVSHSTINLQVGGKTFCSWPIVEAIVRALDGDVERCRKLWTSAA